MRLIDADKLLKDMKRVCKGNCKRCEDYTILSSDLHCGLVDRQPTIQPHVIDKDRLIEEIRKLREYEHEVFNSRGYYDEITCISKDNVIKIINQQSTSDDWIPVSSGEKPKNDEYYIITTNDGLVECAHRLNRRWYTEEATCGWYGDNEILAYMPLPQPYKESE